MARHHNAKLGVILLISLIFILALVTAFFYLRINTIETVKNEGYIGKKIIIRGEVESVVKLGDLSGYSIKDSTGSIRVSSEDLSKEGEMKTVKGILMHDTIFGYYIKE
jgi:hypothetical protein